MYLISLPHQVVWISLRYPGSTIAISKMNYISMFSTFRSLIVSLFLLQLTGCAVLAVVDAAVTTAATAAKVTVKAVGAIADTVIPDSKEKEKEKDKDSDK